MQLLITQFSPVCYHSLPLSPNISLSTPLTLTQYKSTHTVAITGVCFYRPWTAGTTRTATWCLVSASPLANAVWRRYC